MGAHQKYYTITAFNQTYWSLAIARYECSIEIPPGTLVLRWCDTGVSGNRPHQRSQSAVERKSAFEKLDGLMKIQERQIAMKITKSLSNDMTMSQPQHQ